MYFRSGHVPKLIPKSPIMSWKDNIDSPGVVTPPDMQQYPFSSQGGGLHSDERDSSFMESSPLQSKENSLNYSDPYHRQRNDSGPPSESFGTLPREIRGQGHGPPNAEYDPSYPGNRMDKNRASQRSYQSQGLPEDQRSLPPGGHRPFSSSTLPRDMRSMQPDNRSSNSLRGQGYNSLPRDQRSNVPYNEGQGQGRAREYGDNDTAQRRREDNPYMMMVSPQSQHGDER